MYHNAPIDGEINKEKREIDASGHTPNRAITREIKRPSEQKIIVLKNTSTSQKPGRHYTQQIKNHTNCYTHVTGYIHVDIILNTTNEDHAHSNIHAALS